MTYGRRHVNRRNVLSSTAGALAAGLAGCLGDDGDTTGAQDDEVNGDDTGNEDSNGGTENDGPPDVSDWSDEELRTGFIEPILDALNEHRVEEFNELRHRNALIDSLAEGGSGGTGPRLESNSATLVEQTENELVIEATVTIEGSEQVTWPFEFRAQETEWRLWDIDTEEQIREPALSPVVIVEEFVAALNDGDSEHVATLLFEDGDYDEDLFDVIDDFENRTELVETAVLDRGAGVAEIVATVSIRQNGSEEQTTWQFEVHAIGDEWQITVFR